MVGIRKEVKGKRSRLIVKAHGETPEEILDNLMESAEELKYLTPNASGEFFLEVGDLALDEEQLEKLMKRLNLLGLKLIGIKGSNPITKISAANLGLKVISSSLIGVNRGGDGQATQNSSSTSSSLKEPSLKETKAPKPSQDRLEETQPQGPLGEALSSGNQVKILERNLRSGTRIDFDGNIILLGNVNPGAEINATGSIVVLGTLRGVAHAGVNGNEKAFIYASKFQASSVKIAGKHIPIDKELTLECCLIRLEDGKASLRSLSK